MGRHAQQKRKRIKEELLLLLFPLLRPSLLSDSSDSCSKSAFKQDNTNIKNSYPADLFTKNQKTVGMVELLKFSSGTGIIGIKRSCMKKLTVYLN